MKMDNIYENTNINMDKLKIGDVTITRNEGKITYFLPEKMTGMKFKEFKRRNNQKIKYFIK